MKKVACIQPHFMPYLGTLMIQALVDEFYYMTDVQFEPRSWQHRNRIRTPFHKARNYEGEIGWTWLRVPTVHAKRGTPEMVLQNIRVNNKRPWREEHLWKISQYYSKSKWFSEYFPELEELYTRPWGHLASLDIELTRWLMEKFEVETQTCIEGGIPYDRDTGHTREGKTQRLINFCDAVGADLYLEPEGGLTFIVEQMFKDVGIELRFFHFDEEDKYKQLWPGWVPKMSSIDALFCLGPRAKNLIKVEWYNTEIREDMRDKGLDWGNLGA